MKIEDLNTKEDITWCPGCPNFGILEAFKQAILELVKEKKIERQEAAVVTGIGCHAKIFDYLNLNAFYGIHGRVLPVCLGIKISNPKLKVIGFGGDGDTYSEGVSHFIHACRYNADLTMIVHNNQVFALTVGQASSTTEKGFVDGSTPLGVKEEPLNPIALALISGATFVARGYALEKEHLKNLIKQAIEHKGFAFVDILQPCIIFHNVVPYFQRNIYKLNQSHDPANFQAALKKSQEWDYSFGKPPHQKFGSGGKDKKVPIGIFYKTKKPTLEEEWPQLKKPWHTFKREINWEKTIDEFR